MGTRMDNLTREQIMRLSDEKLLDYINSMLKLGYTLSTFSRDKGIKRQKLRDRLANAGYTYNDERKEFVKPIDSISIDAPNKCDKTRYKGVDEEDSIITLKELLERIEALETRLNNMQKVDEENTNELKPIVFNSKTQQRNYPLHEEVTELLAEVHRQNPHLKVKDIVNHLLYQGLLKAIHSK